MKRNPKPENIAKLTPEQLAIFHLWQEEADKSEELMQRLLDATVANDKEAIASLMEQLDELIPRKCEHGVSVFRPCVECNTIEQILFPEAWDAQGNYVAADLSHLGYPYPKSDKMLN